MSVCEREGYIQREIKTKKLEVIGIDTRESTPFSSQLPWQCTCAG